MEQKLLQLANQIKEASQETITDFIFENYDVTETNEEFDNIFATINAEIFIDTYTEFAIDEGQEIDYGV